MELIPTTPPSLPAGCSAPTAELGASTATIVAAAVSDVLMRGATRRLIVRRLGLRGAFHRHRRPAERGQVHAVQRFDEERRARRQLSVRHHRAERRRRRRPRCPAGEARRAVLQRQDHPGDGELRRHRRHRARSQRGSGARQQVPRPHPRGRRDLPGGAGVRGSRRHARRGARRSGGRHLHHQHRADPGRPADRRRTAAAPRARGPDEARAARHR